MKTVKETYAENIIVPAEAIDSLGHVNNVIYLEWVQRISQQHWQKVVPFEERQKMLWVVLNHYIEYRNPAFEGEELLIETWVEQMQGVKSERHVRIIRKEDEKVIVQVKTMWCLIDSVSKKPKRIEPKLAQKFLN